MIFLTELEVFAGDGKVNPTVWMQRLQQRVLSLGWMDEKAIEMFEILITEGTRAFDWWCKLDSSVKSSWKDVRAEFNKRWPPKVNAGDETARNTELYLMLDANQRIVEH